METLEIPEVIEMPNPSPYDADAVGTADFLMTTLLRKLPSMLHAEFQDGDGRWFIKDAQRLETGVTQSKTVGEFRAVLARFGHHYMGGQLYGGHIRWKISQKGRNFFCEIFMSNQGMTGYWIRVYARELA